MWRLVKADFQYNWHVFIIPGFLVFVLLIYVGFVLGWPELEEDLPGTRSLLMIMTAFVFFVRFLMVMGERRDRCHALLPLPVTGIALSRLISVICLWLGLVILYWVSTLTAKPFQTEIIVVEMVTVSGFILMANALPYVHRDILVNLQKDYRRVLWMIFYAVAICAGIVLFLALNVTQSSWRIMRVFLPLKGQFSAYSASLLGSGLFFLSGLALTWMSVCLFKKRKAFVE